MTELCQKNQKKVKKDFFQATLVLGSGCSVVSKSERFELAD
jgi:hypothetical protein